MDISTSVQLAGLFVSLLAVFFPIIASTRNKKKELRQKSEDILIGMAQATVINESIKSYIEVDCMRQITGYEAGTKHFFDGIKKFEDPVAATEAWRSFSHFYPKFPDVSKRQTKKCVLAKFSLSLVVAFLFLLMTTTLMFTSTYQYSNSIFFDKKEVPVSNFYVERVEKSNSQLTINLELITQKEVISTNAGPATQKNDNKHTLPTKWEYVTAAFWFLVTLMTAGLLGFSFYVMVYVAIKLLAYFSVNISYLEGAMRVPLPTTTKEGNSGKGEENKLLPDEKLDDTKVDTAETSTRKEVWPLFEGMLKYISSFR